MMFKVIAAVCFLLASFSAHSIECAGLKKCALEYAVMTNTEVEFEKEVNFDMVSLASEGTAFEKADAFAKFTEFLALNLLSLDHYKDGKAKITNLRKGIYITSPIFLVTPGNIPPVFAGEGPVTLVYKTNKDFKDIKGWRLNLKLNAANTIEIPDRNLVAISDTYENASAIMTMIFSNDK